MTKKDLKERDIQDYIFDNMNKIDNTLYSISKEKTVARIPRLRCDIFGYRQVPHFDCKIPFYSEVKYNNNNRDLLYELNKILYIKDTRKHKYGLFIIVFIDEGKLESHEIDFMKENNILLYTYKIKQQSPLELSFRKIL